MEGARVCRFVAQWPRRPDPEGWIVDEWEITEPIAALVQPYVDEPIDWASGYWQIGSAAVIEKR